jgi:hypothetical protein
MKSILGPKNTNLNENKNYRNIDKNKLKYVSKSINNEIESKNINIEVPLFNEIDEKVEILDIPEKKIIKKQM